MRLSLLLLAAGLALTPPALAGQPVASRVFSADYTISYYGLKVARSSFTSTIMGDDFHVTGKFSSAGLAAVFAPTSGTTDVTGKFSASGAVPSRYALVYKNGGKPARTDIVYAKGNVVSWENTPAPKQPRPPNFVPVTAEVLKSAFDPLTASMIRADSANEVCQRTLRIFDGGMRADFALSPAGTTTFSAGDTKGEAVRCKARFTPIAGYHKGSKDVDYLRRKATIEIAFADTGVAGLWAPVAISLGSEIGTFRLTATRFGD